MAIVTAPNADYSGEVAGVMFTDGVGETSDEWALAYFTRHGYAIDDGDTGDGLDGLKVAELRELAEFFGVDLEGASKKAEIIEVLRAAELDVDSGADADADSDTEGESAGDEEESEATEDGG